MEMNNHVQILTEPVSSVACPKCGAMLEVPDIPAFSMVQCPTCEFEFMTPAKFGSFLLLQILGMGGMGGVYRARDEALNREVAIKVMLKSLGDDPQFVETFQREAQAAAKLNHSHIAQIYSFGQVMGQPYIAMELIPGGSLDKMMASQGALDPAVVFKIGAQIAEGLNEAAEANLVHGDVKPENILFDAEKNAKLVDFGLAAMQSGNEVWGTPYYISPEKVRKQKTDFRADIYSLGATLYHAIAGTPPFDGPDAAAVVKARFDGAPKSLRSIRGNAVPEEVEGIIMRMLATDPAQRYPTYGSLLGDMQRYLSKAGPVSVASSGKKIMIKGKRPKPVEPSAVEGEGLPEGMVPIDQLEAEDESERLARRRGRKILMLVLLGIVVLIGAIAGGIVGIMKSQETKRIKSEAAQLAKTQEAASASIAKSVSEAKKFAERVGVNVPEAMKYANEALDAVVSVLGESVRAQMIPPEPSYEIAPPAEPENTSSNAAPAQVDGGKIMLPPELTEKLAKVLPEELMKVVNELGTLSPEEAIAKIEAVVKALPEESAELKQEVEKGLAFVKMMAGGMGDAMAAAMGGAMQQMVAAMGGAVAEDDEDAEEAAHPVVAIVRELFMDAYSVKKANAMAVAYVAEIEAMASAAEKLKTPGQEKKLVEQANAIVDKAKTMGNTRELTDATRTVIRMKKTLESVKVDAASLEENRRQNALQKEKDDKRAAELEKQRLEREAFQAKTESEIARVRGMENEIIPMLKQLQIREATRLLHSLTDSLETKGGLDEQAIMEERIKRIEELHKYMVEKAPGFKSMRGWSIETADAKTVTVGGKKVTWSEIFESRMEIAGELINGLVMNPQATKNMRLRERTRLEVNAALCLVMFYGDVPSAVERAKQIATQAAENFEVDADIIKKLMPEFFE